MDMMQENYKKNKRKDSFFKYFFAFFAILAIVFLGVITLYIFVAGIKPFITGEYSFWSFLTGMKWSSNTKEYGILFMILGTVASTILAAVMAIPIGIFTAAAVCELLPEKLGKCVETVIELLASIPSIIYGMIGIIVLVPFFKDFPGNGYAHGQSLLVVSLVLAIMILPTIVIISITSLRAVPFHLREASRGLGASKIKTIFKVVVPTAKKGIVAGIVLGIGRAVGETMAVAMVAGNVGSGFAYGGAGEMLFQAIRPLTVNISMNIGEASGLQRELLFSTALVLFFFIFLLNMLVQKISGGKNEK